MLRNLKSLISEQFTALSRLSLPRVTAEAVAIYRKFPMYMPELPDVNTSARNSNNIENDISYRGAYFLLYMEAVGMLATYARYKGSILNKDNTLEIKEKLKGSGIVIDEELDILQKWPMYDDRELLSAYLSVLLKIQALDITLKVGIELTINNPEQ